MKGWHYEKLFLVQSKWHCYTSNTNRNGVNGLLSLRSGDQKELGALWLFLSLYSHFVFRRETLWEPARPEYSLLPVWALKPAGEERQGENACSARRGREFSQVTFRKLGQPPSWAYPGSWVWLVICLEMNVPNIRHTHILVHIIRSMLKFTINGLQALRNTPFPVH